MGRGQGGGRGEEEMKKNHCLIGDNRDSMRFMLEQGGAGTVQTIVTSPPYWGLRDYGVAGQLGQEPTLREFLDNMVDVFSLARDLLSDDGTLWLNMGDSYADKELCGQPWRLAFALQDAGWYLRQDIIWSKPNPMPESVRDRCTKSHEYLFLLSKSERYFWDREAMQEQAAPSSIDRWAQNVEDHTGSDRVPGKTNGNMKAVGGPRSKRDSFKRDDSKRAEIIPGQTVGTHRADRDESEWDLATRNRRSVWTVPTVPYSGAHFATFPPALIEPCILAGSRVGDIVFDPFLGSGTTAQVAQALGRHWIGCELNPEYVKLQKKRTAQLGLTLEIAA